LKERSKELLIIRPAIVGIAETTLTPQETQLFASHPPLGIILFARNIQSPAQLAGLIGQIKTTLPHALLMVDQEGGRVARLRAPYWRAHPPAAALHTPRAAWLTGALIGLDCATAGFHIAAAPVLDVGSPGGHDVIGDRAFSTNPETVATLGSAFAAGLLAAGIQPIGKHAPGHGRALADSHLTLPSLETVTPADLLPFARNRHFPWLMTAHIRYNCVDMTNPATQSPAIIARIIRAPDGIGFPGLLITDDLAMHALTGTPSQRALRALAAGCDVALHCSGIIEETTDLLSALPPVPTGTLARIAAARAHAEAARQELDGGTLAAERAALLS
jgi:beta-N-acetylhexosaminidase